MSKCFIEGMGGGGTGIAKLPAIYVIYPAGSVCTCTNGDKTYKAKDTGGYWLFAGLSIGTWTLTITAGAKKSSATAEITSGGETVTVTLYYRLIMVPNDDYATFWKGVTSNGIYGSYSIKSDSIYVMYSDHGRTYVQTADKIFCTKGSKLSINVSSFINEATAYNGKSYLYISETGPSAVSQLIAYTQITSTGAKTLSIESEGSYYIGILNLITGGGGTYPTKKLSTTVNSFVLSLA